MDRGFGEKLADMQHAGCSPLRGSTPRGTLQNAQGSVLDIDAFPLQVDQFPDADTCIKRKQNHVVQFRGVACMRTFSRQKHLDLPSRKDTKPSIVAAFDMDGTAALAQDRRILSRKQHHARHGRLRLQREIIDLPDRFQTMQYGLWAQRRIGIVFCPDP